MIRAEKDYITYGYNLFLLCTSLYTLTRIALENENKYLDSKGTDTSAHNTDLGDNLNYTFQYDYSDYYAHRLYKVGGRYYGYDENGNITVERDGEYINGYVYENVKVGTSNDGRDIYRLNWAIGIEEQPKVRADVYQKSYEYDERDRLIYARDNFSLYSIYRYDESGERSNKYNYFSEEETLCTNRYFSTSINSFNREYEGQSIKHIFLNNERLVTKTALNKINGTEHAYRDYEKSHTYYYHSDHLGSATLITDYKGKEYQRIEYTPYGESWIELSKNIDNYLPYRFTGKELDEETGFYYYGQRYLDPRYSIWHTSDPAIYDYMSQSKEG